MSHARWLVVCLLFASVLIVPAARAQESALGRVDFPTSGKPEAQAHFLRGVLALHSFWFEEALEEFRASTQADPDFAMGYWGEAMALNHPLWAEQDTEAARKVVAKIPVNAAVTPRERAYLDAVRALYGEGDKLDRDRAYAVAMEKVYRQYPNDLEAACFYALSLLGTWRPGDKGFARQVKAGAIVLDVFQKNPDHPGAAHYIIHSFDDPEHAILALPAARRYASIAPEAHHARHMPAHIFIQLGMWPEAAASNESAWAASVAWVSRKNLPGSLRDFHSLHWLFYVYLQQGRYAKAEEVFALRQKTLAEADASTATSMRTSSGGRYYTDMAAEYVIEMERWDKAAELFDRYGTMAPAVPAASTGAHAGHGGGPSADPQSRAYLVSTFVRGLADAQKDPAAAEKSAATLAEIRKKLADSGDTYRARAAEVMELMVAARASATKKNWDDAIERMKRATALEEEIGPPSGPPDLLKPSHELFGEILMAAGKPKEAVAQFAVALQRQPNRARSLLGTARAAAKSGDPAAAAAAYGKLLEIWQQADTQLAELREAREFVRQQGTRAGAGR